MTTAEPHDRRHRPSRRTTASWAVPVCAVLLGVGYLAAGLRGGQPGFGVFGLVLMCLVATVFVLAGRRSETMAFLRDQRDERVNHIDAAASRAAGSVVLCAIVVAFMVQIARGHSGSPYYQLGALGGVTYVVSLVYLMRRR